MTIERIKKIERMCYPVHMRQMQDCHTWHDINAYCEAPASVICTDNAYCLYTDREIIDIASIAPRDTISIFHQIRRELSGRRLYVDLRKSTSYRIVQRLNARHFLRFDEVDHWDWDGVAMVSGYIIFSYEKKNPDIKKIRRRIEDRLRKSDSETIFRIAKILGIRLD